MIPRVIPKIFYDSLDEGLDLFARCLGFQVRHRDGGLTVVEGDGAKVYVVASAEYAAKDRPELTIETDTIHDLYERLKAAVQRCFIRTEIRFSENPGVR